MTEWLSSHQFPVPQMWQVADIDSWFVARPLVPKPRRGRGSQGVRLLQHLSALQDGVATDGDLEERVF